MTTTSWRKSSFCSGGDCIEVGFQTSSYCHTGGCVGYLHHPDGTVQIRDTKDPEGPTLTFTADEWRAFIAGAKNGEFDLPEQVA